MKLLVIGGSYFFGRVFVMQAAKEHDITVANRGTYSMEALGVKQIKGDRRDEAFWKSCGEDYDAVVDFCTYEESDIARVLRNMPGKIRQYIFISTVDVYERGIKGMKGEDAPFERRVFPGEAGSYIAGKVSLEQEAVRECARRGTACTVLRPAVLYGPFNYAPRESEYIRMMVQEHILLHITDAAGAFQFVYVKDAAEAVIKCLLNEKTYGQAYNLCGGRILNYDLFFEALRDAADVELEVVSVTAEEAGRQGIPLPFPVGEEESELYSDEKSIVELGMCYTELSTGMERTYRAFKGVWQDRP